MTLFNFVCKPIQARETSKEELEPVTVVGFVYENQQQGQKIAELVSAIETGRRLARDVGGADPERMSAPNIVKYLKEAFEGKRNLF